MIYYRVYKYKVTPFSLIKLGDYTGEVFVTLEDAKDEFVKVKQGCKQEKLLDSTKKFQIEIWRYDDENDDYEERIEKVVI